MYGMSVNAMAIFSPILATLLLIFIWSSLTKMRQRLTSTLLEETAESKNDRGRQRNIYMTQILVM